jgi:hypothetical protein
MNTKKLPCLFVIAAIVLFFVTHQKLLPNVFYTITAAVLGIYFFPVKMILELVKKKGLKTIIVAIVSNYLYGAVLCMAAVWLYDPDSSFFRTLFSVIGLANAVTGLAYFLFSIDDEKALLHFIMNVPCAALL